MQVYFTSPTLGRIYGTVTTADGKLYHFKGETAYVNVELFRTEKGWMCLNEQRLHDHQIVEVGLQIDNQEQQLSA